MLPVLTFGQEKFSSNAAISSRAPSASRICSKLLRRRSPSRRRSAAPAAWRRSGRSSAMKRVEALVRQADRVDHSRPRLPQPRRRIAGARLERDRLRDVGRERERCSNGVAEDAARGDRVVGARSVDDRVRRARCRRTRGRSAASVPRPRDQRGLKPVAVEHGAVDAEPQVAVDRRHDAAETGAEAAGHAATPSPARPARRARRTARAPLRASPADRRRRRSIAAGVIAGSSSAASRSVTKP